MYPTGQEPTFWAPDPSELTHRFALGCTLNASARTVPLVVIGMNPSYASDQVADKTVNRIIEVSVDLGYAGWIMLNLYPERATKPKNLRPYDSELSAANCTVVADVLEIYDVTEVLVGAWGGGLHPTIRRAKRDVLAMLRTRGTKLFSFDPPTADREPRHPTPRTGPLPMLGPKRYFA